VGRAHRRLRLSHGCGGRRGNLVPLVEIENRTFEMALASIVGSTAVVGSKGKLNLANARGHSVKEVAATAERVYPASRFQAVIVRG
jgi:hypothetical protein